MNLESEYTIGITDSRPHSWKKVEPLWKDEQLTGVTTSQTTFLDVMTKVCETAIKKRRENRNDYGVNEHMWKLKIIASSQEAMKPPKQFDFIADYDTSESDDEDEDDSDDENEASYRGSILILCPQEEEFRRNNDYDDDYDDERDCQFLKCSTDVTKQLLPIGSIIECTYDYGSTTTLYLKVLDIKLPTVVKNLFELGYFFVGGNTTNNKVQKGIADLRDLQTVPAYHLPKNEQIDFHFPSFSKVFLGHYVPLLRKKRKTAQKENHNDGADDNNDDDNDDHDDESYDNTNNKKAIGRSTLGLSSCITSEDDTTFCSMENRTSSGDVMYCPAKIELNEFLQVVEHSWTPRDPTKDPDKLHQCRYDMVCRFIVPSDNDDVYNRVVEQSNCEYAMWGPKVLIYRLPKKDAGDTIVVEENDDTKKNNESDTTTFDFKVVFPKTYFMLSKANKTFRWFQYNNNILRVLVGRGVGEDHRSFESRQILRTWTRAFESFHELLCAVEVSWVCSTNNGNNELTPNTTLVEFDTDLGPSNPGPKDPTCYSKEKDCVIISQLYDKKKLVTAMAITDEMEDDENGKKRKNMILYSGHDDGTLVKWSLNNNTQLWSNQIYKDETEQTNRTFKYIGVVIHETMGVAGIAIRPHPSKEDNQLIYTWTNNIELAVEEESDDEDDDASDNSTPTEHEFKPAAIQSWSAKDGSHVRTYNCDVGDSENNISASPSIATVVFCKLFVDNSYWVDSIVVGLYCAQGAYIKYEDKYYSDFDLEEAQEAGQGTILPFYENSNGRAMETWRGAGVGLIRAMAVVNSKYLFTFNVCEGHGRAESMMLWDLENPGVPLYLHSLRDFSRSIFKQSLTRIEEVSGISVSDNNILLADNYADRIVVVTVKENGYNQPYLELLGYGRIGNKHYADSGFQGCMAMFGPYAVMANEINNTGWLFNIKDNSNHSKLDSREGDSRKFIDHNTGEDDSQTYEGRDIAVGKICFPKFGGNAPPKQKKRSFFPFSSMESDSDSFGLKDQEEENSFGEGGPIAMAIRDRFVVAGFTNGSIARSSLLPKQFESYSKSARSEHTTRSSNTLSSCCSLSTCEWRVPQLEVFD